jgi:putative ABC transport system permease protein
LAIVAGVFLSMNLFISLVYQQRREFAVFRAIGGSRRSTVGIAVVQATIIATIGGVIGLALSPILGSGLSYLAAAVTGFEGLVQIPPIGYLLGASVSILFGLLGTVIGVIRVSRERAVARLG